VPDLSIVDVKVGAPRIGELGGLFDYDELPRFIDVIIQLKNNSTTPLFVVSSIRRLTYDVNSRLLRLSFAEPPPEPDPEFLVMRPAILPSFILISSGKTTPLEVSIPQIIEHVRSFNVTEDGIDRELIDVSGFERIQCLVAYNDTPFEPEERAQPEAILRQLSSWGATVERTLRPKTEPSGNSGAE
jgi:hypothetical protein